MIPCTVALDDELALLDKFCADGELEASREGARAAFKECGFSMMVERVMSLSGIPVEKESFDLEDDVFDGDRQ